MTATWLTSRPDPTAAGLPPPLFIHPFPKTDNDRQSIMETRVVPTNSLRRLFNGP